MNNIKNFIFNLLEKDYTISKDEITRYTYNAINKKSKGCNRISYMIFLKPIDGRWFICTLKSGKEGRHILIDDFTI